MSTAAAMSDVIGETGFLLVAEGIKVAVRVLDVKTAYGNLRYQIEPLSGEGSAWIDHRRLIRGSQ